MILYQGSSDDRELFKIPVNTFSNGFAAKLSNCAAFLGKKVQALVWHKRLGHPSKEILAAMIKALDITVSKDSSSSMCMCQSCIRGKMSRQPFIVNHDKASNMFDKIHSDVWGPSPTKSIEGYRYYMNFVDEYSSFMLIFPMVNKSDVFDIFVKFYAFISTQFNASIKCFQSDGGGEFMSQLFKEFLSRKRIKNMVSCPYTPQQNSLAERKHRHVVETAIILMAEANLAPKFWYHACAHATLLINRMPCKVLEMKSPYQCLFGRVPEVNYFKIFGTIVYPFLRHFNANKLQFRSTQNVFLGYATEYKGVICYNGENDRLILSRHAIHDETVCPFKKTYVSEANSMSNS